MIQNPVSQDAIVVSITSFQSDTPAEIVGSNISFLNALFEEYLTSEEVSADALRSYYVDYYLAQVNNGGFSQFVYNSGWNPKAIALVREGLFAMKARKHLEVFEEGVQLVETFRPDQLASYFEGEYFGENPDRDALNAINDRFWQVDKEEGLVAPNAAWLRNHPGIVVLTAAQMQAEVHRRGQSLPDRDQRIATARANEPRYIKLIRSLCDQAGHEFAYVTAGDPTRVHEGTPTVAWHFITDQGHYHMVEADGKAIMFQGHSTTDRVCAIEASEE